MKSPPANVDDCDDIFGPPRTYPSGYAPPKNRPSMISAKYRQKEERRKILKISAIKLDKIEDPETSLCRSVLINNTMKKLEQDARNEVIQKQHLNYPHYDNDNYLNIKNEFLRNETKVSESVESVEDVQPMQTETSKVEEDSKVDFIEDNDFDKKLAEEINKAKALNGLVDENLSSLASEGVSTSADNSEILSSRKRSFDDVDDCDVQNVLSEFYMPPTPTMLTCIDEEDDVSIAQTTTEEPPAKKVKLETPDCEATQSAASCDTVTEFCVVNSFINNNGPSTTAEARLRFVKPSSSDTDSNPYSCGHASMFSDIHQTNVYHSLIASLET